jgi:PIN domain nuclease of toxin-antitoxin system
LRLLLDTHIALWAIVDDARLPKLARELLEDPRNIISVSAVSIWEIAIKFSLGRGDMPVSSRDALRYFRQAGYDLVSVEPQHAVVVEGLPPIHADPFDRLLVAQALTEPMRLMTHDAVIAQYDKSIIVV